MCEPEAAGRFDRLYMTLAASMGCALVGTRTSALALKVDPGFGPIARRFYENPDELADAFATAWYKLLHRDMGPVSR